MTHTLTKKEMKYINNRWKGKIRDSDIYYYLEWSREGCAYRMTPSGKELLPTFQEVCDISREVNRDEIPEYERPN